MKWLLAGQQRPALVKVVAARPVLAFDFDGVLAPIEARPPLAGIQPRTRRLLRLLCRRFPCAVISGRSLSSLRPRLRGIPFAFVVGNHGLEWQRPDPREPRWALAVSAWLHRLEGLGNLAGVELENKRLSISVHYRGAKDRHAARRRILMACDGLERAEVVGGHCVVNVIPAGAIDKGRALRIICGRLRRSAAVFVGDDLTDENVFKLHGDWPALVGVRVGRLRTSHAAYFLRRQEELADLMQVLLAQKR